MNQITQTKTKFLSQTNFAYSGSLLPRPLRFLIGAGLALTASMFAAGDSHQVTEAYAGASSTAVYAITSMGAISLTSQNVVDSYDSRDPAKSTNGFYDPAKRQSNGNIVSNGNGSLVNIGGAYVYGGVGVNGGTPKGTQNVTGGIMNFFYQAYPDITSPTWNSSEISPSAITRVNYTLATGSMANPKRYRLSDLTLKGNTLTFAPPVNGGDGYVEIWLTKDAGITNGSQIIIPSNVYVFFYVTGVLSVNGSAFVNESRNAAHLAFYGIAPKPGTTKQWSYDSGSNFIGTIYGPEVKLKISGAGNFFGAVIVNTMTLGGSVAFHVDEALFGSSSSYGSLIRQATATGALAKE